MRRLLLLLMLATTCYAICPDSALVFRNSEWVANNLVVKLVNFFYDSISRTSEDSCSPAKRFVSIFSLIKMIYLTTDANDIGKAIAIARSKAETLLKNTAAAIAGTFRGVVDRILSIIDQPLNDILIACSPDTYEDECQNRLREIRIKNERVCNGYSKHVSFYDSFIRWAGNQENIAYMNDVITASTETYNDTSVLDYFEKLATKYKSTFQELRSLFMTVKAGGFNCNVLTFTNTICV